MDLYYTGIVIDRTHNQTASIDYLPESDYIFNEGRTIELARHFAKSVDGPCHLRSTNGSAGMYLCR